MTIDLIKLVKYILKRIWIPILCAVIGFGFMYYRAVYKASDTYTAKATMYVFNGNPNAVNYQYTNISDLNTAVQLVDTYAVVVRSNKVMNAVAERLNYNLPAEYLASTLSMGSVSETGVMYISCTTPDPQLSMDICNAVADIAPAEIIRVVNAGSVEVIDYADLPLAPNGKQGLKKGIIGALAGGVLACGILLIFFLSDRRVSSGKELTENYELPLLAEIPKQSDKSSKKEYLIGEKSQSHLLSSYARLRMNLMFTMHNKVKTLLVSSSVPGESKSTVTANLAISFAMDGKHVLLIDGDMRKPMQDELFELNSDGSMNGGLSDMLIPDTGKPCEIFLNVRPNLDILPAGTIPPNPCELLNSPEMRAFLNEKDKEYDIVIVDMPPINVVSDPLVLSDTNIGMLFVVRCNYSDHREIKRALEASELTGTNMLGVVLTCVPPNSDGYYLHNKYYYKRYYGSYDKKKGSYGYVPGYTKENKKN